MAKQYDVLFRLLLIGDSGVGKTCLLCRFTDNEFHSSHISTIDVGAQRRALAVFPVTVLSLHSGLAASGRDRMPFGKVQLGRFSQMSLLWVLRSDGTGSVDFKMKTIEVDGIKVRIQIWDTAGQERYQTITKQYYRRAQGIFLVYDISSERSYQHIMKWVSDVDEYAPEGVQKILIGNKADEEQKRQVGREQGQQLAKEYGMDFYETSACTSLNIKEENCQNEEILNSLKYVRPGGGYQPTFSLTQKCEVNGQNEHPVFAYLKDKLPYPYDDPFSLMTDPKLIMWSPVRRSDVAWNFEKFLIGPEGEPFRRYSRTFQTIHIEPDIKRLLKVAI
ncbi:hypothetical protein STEG23_007332 [Scotinomys teguina]